MSQDKRPNTMKYQPQAAKRGSGSTQTTSVLSLCGQLEWKIENWNILKQIYPKDKELSSRAFHCSNGASRLTWIFGVCPNSSSVSQDPPGVSNIGVSLEAITCAIPVYAKITISALKPDSTLVKLCTESQEFSPTIRNWNTKINASNLESLVDSNGDLTFVCEIGAAHADFVITKSDKSEDAAAVQDQSSAVLTQLYETMYQTDFAIKVGEELIPCHKCILGSCSPVFTALIRKSDMEGAKKRFIEISDCSALALNTMLEFIYTGNAKGFNDVIVDLFNLSNKYQISSLKWAVEKHLERQINTETACILLQLADSHNLDCLKNQIVTSTSIDWDKLLSGPEWNALKSTNQSVTNFVMEKLLKRSITKGDKPRVDYHVNPYYGNRYHPTSNNR